MSVVAHSMQAEMATIENKKHMDSKLDTDTAALNPELPWGSEIKLLSTPWSSI